MKKYKFGGEDAHTFKIQHPDGSMFSIAKRSVGPGVHKHIKSLEPVMMADGGEVPDEDYGSNSSVSNLIAEPVSNAEMQAVAPQYQTSAQPAPLEIEPAANPEPLPEAPARESQNRTVASQPKVSNPINDAYANSFAQKESGIKQLAGAQSQAANAQAAAYEEQSKQLAKQIDSYQQEHARLDAEHRQLTDAVLNQKIDPNRLWNESSTGSKILAGIGVALSGLGAGLARRPDMANSGIDVMNKTIDRDIDSQKMELGKKQTLLSENLSKTHDLDTATQMTRLQMNALTQAKVQQIAAQSGSAQAQANAKVMLGDLGLQAAQLKQQLALAQAQAKSLGVGGGTEGGIPVGQEPYPLLADPKYQAKRVIVNGRAYQHAGAGPDAQNYRNVESVAGGVNDLVHQLDQLGPEATIPGTAENNKAQALRYQLSTEIPKLKSMQIGAKRVNETEAERAEHMISDPTSFKQLMNGGVRNDVFFKTLDDELERSRKDNLIGYKGKTQYKFKPGI